MKQKINFQKLIDRQYSLNVELEVINWLLKTGLSFDEYLSRWDRDGVNRQLFAYSANNNIYRLFPFPLNENLNVFIDSLFVRAIVKSGSKPIQRWREKERIFLDKSRFITFVEEFPTQKINNWNYWNLYWLIIELQKFTGMFLKKEFCKHPDNNELIKPKITEVCFSTSGHGYNFLYKYSFEKYNYENGGWEVSMNQNENESIDMFIFRIYSEINKLIINPY